MKPDDLKSLVAYRMGQAQSALEDAKILMEKGRSTTTIANRSYYAMFYAVLALLQIVGKQSSKHSGIISLFDREFVKEGIFSREMSKSLHDAFDLRQEADYEIFSPPEPEELSRIWKKASEFVQIVQTYLMQQGYLGKTPQ